MSARKPTVTNNLMQFDSVGFASLLNSKRNQLGWSTRELAQRANISQPYVVALERARIQNQKRKRRQRQRSMSSPN